MFVSVYLPRHLSQPLERGEFPHWADSLGIPLMGMPIIGFGLGGWALLYCLFLLGRFSSHVDIFTVPLKKWNIWLVLVIVLSGILVAWSAIDGYVLPGTIWIYFYLSINAGRYHGQVEQGASPNRQPS